MTLQHDHQYDETPQTDVSEPSSSSPSTAETPSKTKRIMRSDNPIVQACLGELFRFSSPSQIETRLRSLRRQFICVDGDEPDSLILWVHGFQVTTGEDTQGFVGHFACIAGKALPDGALTLSITKVPMPLADHPHKKRPKQPHPNGAHPIMRRINKGYIYPTEEEALHDLAALHAEFPDVSIPASPEKLYIILYDRSDKTRGPVRKVVMRVVPVEDENANENTHTQGYKIVIKDNNRRSGGGKGIAAMALSGEQMGR
ncbi:MAG: hypothetical protein ACK5O4_00250 [bacterium]|jgi:hypothetical protein